MRSTTRRQLVVLALVLVPLPYFILGLFAERREADHLALYERSRLAECETCTHRFLTVRSDSSVVIGAYDEQAQLWRMYRYAELGHLPRPSFIAEAQATLPPGRADPRDRIRQGVPWRYALLPAGAAVDIIAYVSVLLTITVVLYALASVVRLISRFIESLPARVRNLRRNRRLARRLCPECAFDLSHAALPGCPECGWNREPLSACPQGAGDGRPHLVARLSNGLGLIYIAGVIVGLPSLVAGVYTGSGALVGVGTVLTFPAAMAVAWLLAIVLLISLPIYLAGALARAVRRR